MAAVVSGSGSQPLSTPAVAPGLFINLCGKVSLRRIVGSNVLYMPNRVLDGKATQAGVRVDMFKDRLACEPLEANCELMLLHRSQIRPVGSDQDTSAIE